MINLNDLEITQSYSNFMGLWKVEVLYNGIKTILYSPKKILDMEDFINKNEDSIKESV